MYLIFFYVNINIGDCMLVRLGYVAISTAIDVTSSSPYTYSEYLNKCNIDKLDDVIKSNLLGLEEILKYNVKNNIHFSAIRDVSLGGPFFYASNFHILSL